jgi:hypothetical protein
MLGCEAPIGGFGAEKFINLRRPPVIGSMAAKIYIF